MKTNFESIVRKLSKSLLKSKRNCSEMCGVFILQNIAMDSEHNTNTSV